MRVDKRWWEGSPNGRGGGGGGALRNKLDKVHRGMTFFACQGRGVGLSLEDNKSDFADPPPHTLSKESPFKLLASYD